MPETLWRLVYALCQRIVWLVTFVSMRLFANFSVTGRGHLKGIPTPLLIVANHRSFWDSMIIGTLFPFLSNAYLPVGFMAVDEYFRRPLFKAFFVLTGTYPAYKGQGIDVSLRYLRSVLARNGVALLFPFGKLIFDDEVQRGEVARRGAGFLVQEFFDLTVLPIYLRTTPNLRITDFLFGRKEMSVFVGRPLRADAAIRAWPPEKITAWLASEIVTLIPRDGTI